MNEKMENFLGGNEQNEKEKMQKAIKVIDGIFSREELTKRLNENEQ